MALRFILGSSGSGKSTYLYEEIVRRAGEQPETTFYVIVPEQFTMQTQRELVKKSGGGILNIDVVSFQRLAYRIFDELGRQDTVVLEETGKNLLLRKVAGDKKGELRVLAGNMKKMGYISEMKSLISELTQYHVSPEQLEDFLSGHFGQEPKEDTALSGAFAYKLADVLVMYRGFREYLSTRYVTAEELLEVLAEVAGESKLLKNSVLALDGFTGFTPIQNYLLERLMKLSQDIYVTLTIDAGEDLYVYRGVQELFAMSKKTIAALTRMADAAGIAVEEPVRFADAQPVRFAHAPMLASLEQNLFRMQYQPYEKDDGNLTICSLQNPKEELIYAAREIKRLVREEVYRYKDIAVVSAGVEDYGKYVPQVFADYEIPYFLDTTKNILLHPFIEFVRAVLEILEKDFSYDAMFRYFRSNLVRYTGQDGQEKKNVPAAVIDRLENYVLASGIRGYKGWMKRFSYLPKKMTQEELEELEELRKEQMALFTPLREVFMRKTVSVKEQSVALYRFFYSMDIEQQLADRRDYYKERCDYTKEWEYAQIYRIVMDVLDKMSQLLEGEELSVREYAEILDAGFEAAKVGVIPGGYDRVTVGDIERTRLGEIRVLIFVGVNDGLVPRSDNGGGIISQLEREELARCELELAPTAREKVFIQRFYLYLVMTKPSDRLYLTYARVGGDGQALRRSYLIGILKRLFPAVPLRELDRQEDARVIVTPKSSLAFYIRQLREQPQTDRKERELFYALQGWYRRRDAYRGLTERLGEAAHMEYHANTLPAAVSRALYGSLLKNSVTRLESFAACACRHFLDYGIDLSEREISQFAAMDMGSLYHLALEKYAARLAETGKSWTQINGEEQHQLIEQSLREAVLESGNQALAQTAKNQYFLYRMGKVLNTTVEMLGEQVRAGRFEPENFEISFAFTQELKAVNFALGEEEKMQLLGRIDRVDTYTDKDKLYVKVIDYKSGKTSFDLLALYHGLQLQLVVYLNAAVEILKRKNPDKEVLPAGIFYYHIDDPVIEGNGQETDTEIYEKILEKLRLDGLVNADEEVYRAMDEKISGRSKVIPVALKKDGSLSGTSKTVTQEEFDIISDYTGELIQRLGRRILDGEVAAEPYRMQDKDGCSYCPYRSVCGFDKKIPGYECRKLDEIAPAEIIRRMGDTDRKEEK